MATRRSRRVTRGRAEALSRSGRVGARHAAALCTMRTDELHTVRLTIPN